MKNVITSYSIHYTKLYEIPIRLHMRAISLTSPMFTERNVFSNSFTISATVAVETVWTRSITPV